MVSCLWDFDIFIMAEVSHVCYWSRAGVNTANPKCLEKQSPAGCTAQGSVTLLSIPLNPGIWYFRICPGGCCCLDWCHQWDPGWGNFFSLAGLTWGSDVSVLLVPLLVTDPLLVDPFRGNLPADLSGERILHPQKALAQGNSPWNGLDGKIKK